MSWAQSANTPPAQDQQLIDLAREFTKRIEPHFLSESEAAYLRIPDGDTVVFEVRIGRYTLDTPLTAIKRGRSIMVPIRELADALYLAISVDETSQAVSGWAFSEDQSVALDPQTGEARFGDKTLTLPAQALYSDGYDIYVHTRALEDWLGFKVDANLRFMYLELETEQTLPIIAQLQRANRRTGSTLSGLETAAHEDATRPYAWLSTPMFDLQASNRLRQLPGQSLNNLLSYSLIAQGDFLKHSTILFLSGTQDNPVPSARITFSRRSSEGDLLGPLKATQLDWGDIQGVSLPFDQGSSIQRGIRVSNQPLFGQADYGTTRFDGDLQPGWDVELYRNDVLIDQQRASENGRYSFDEVMLFAGQNRFVLKFYGPQGQVREEERDIPVTADSQAGLLYNIALTQQGRSVFDQNQGGDAAQEGYRASGSLSMRLGQRSSLTLGLDTPIINGEHHYQGAASLSTFIGNTLLRSTVRVDNTGGFVASAGAGRRIFGQQTQLSYTRWVDYPFTNSERLQNSSALSLAISGQLPNILGQNSPYQLDLRQFQDEGTDPRYEANLRTSRAVLGGSLDTSLRWQDGPNPNDDSFVGDVSWGFNRDRVLTRARLTTNFKEGEVELLHVSSRYRINNDLSTQASASYSFLSKDTTLEARADWDLGLLTLSPRGQWSTTGQWSAFIDGRLSVGWDSVDRQAHITSDRNGAFGALSIRVFEDFNQDGIFNGGDRALEHVRINAIQARRSGLTNARGIAYIARLGTHQASDIEIDLSSLDDPFLAPLEPSFSVIPRPGNTQNFDIAVVPTAELEGVIYVRNGQYNRALTGTPVKIFDLTGRLRGEGRTDGEGYFLISHLPVGYYQIEVDPATLNERNLRLTRSSYVRITRTHEIKGIELTLIDRDESLIASLNSGFSRQSRDDLHQALRGHARGHGYGLALGVYQTPFGRNSALLLALAHYPETLRGIGLIDGSTPGNGQYELEIGPFPNAERAAQACQILKAAYPACAVTVLSQTRQSSRQ
ncbi:stalk domain-containing protein [Woodsholea maritima]|uniref:stalk domain-containing protein n=1 Tax=Woodsholea maritima TaxID=240237 RepID=UPI0003A31887|nr:stalk domain-containing protein [Woodsholea maritima]